MRRRPTLIAALAAAGCFLFLVSLFALLGFGRAAPIGEGAVSAEAAIRPPARPAPPSAASKTALRKEVATASGPGFNDLPDPYNPAAIARDPQSYYSRSVPSRVWQKAPRVPGEPLPEGLLMQVEAVRFVLENGPEGVPMVVRGRPGCPVTFTALDSGHFANGKISVTVPADEFGFARADFWVGYEGQFRVLVGCPENRGTVEFSCWALPAEKLRQLQSGQFARDYKTKQAEKARREKAAEAQARAIATMPRPEKKAAKRAVRCYRNTPPLPLGCPHL